MADDDKRSRSGSLRETHQGDAAAREPTPLTREQAEELARRCALRVAYRTSDWRAESWVVDAIIAASEAAR